METESVNKPEKLASHFQGIQNPMEPEFMIIPNPPLISSDTNSLSQDYYYRSLAVSDDGRFTRVDLDPLYSNAAYRDTSELLETIPLHVSIQNHEFDESLLHLLPITELDSTWLDDAEHQLQEIHAEVEEARTYDSEIDPVPNAAYRDASELLKILFRHRAPMPDIGWLMDGGIGLEWRVTAGRGIATMSLYGDKNVVYGATVGNTYRVKNTCRLSSLPSLASFLKMLTNVFSQ